MKKNFVGILLIFSLLILGCKNDKKNVENNSDAVKTGSDSTSAPKKEYDQDIEVIFQENKKDSKVEDSILKVLHLCDPNQKNLKNYIRPACDAKFFKLFPIKKDSPLKDNFMVLCRSGVAGYPIRRILVYTNSDGEYVLTNTFMADLIGMENNKHSQYKDLILQFMDEDENRFECQYVWREGRYAYQRVMKINRNKIKPKYLDSMKVVIGREINRMKLSY